MENKYNLNNTVEKIKYELVGYDEVIEYLEGLTEITDDEDIDKLGVNDILVNINNLKSEKVKRLDKVKALNFKTNEELNCYFKGIKDMKNHLIDLIDDLKDNGDYEEEKLQGIFHICKSLAKQSENELTKDL